MIDRDHVTTDDGRTLAYEVSGAPDGYPIFLMHGTPGSKTGPKPRAIFLYRLGVKLICYDRPGYGSSTRWEGRSVADAATDVEIIANKLNLPQFAVVGRSGGGPHALACAAILSERVSRASVLVGIAPPLAPDLDWYAGMTDANVEEYMAADGDLEELIERLTSRAELARQDPESMVKFLIPQMSQSDLRVVDDITIRRLLYANYKEALQDGPDGWIDDALAFRKPWGFDLGSIMAPVKLWHGEDDTFSPVNHTYWLQSQLRNADVEIQVGAAHFGAIEILPKILVWLADAEAFVRTGEAR